MWPFDSPSNEESNDAKLAMASFHLAKKLANVRKHSQFSPSLLIRSLLGHMKIFFKNFGNINSSFYELSNNTKIIHIERDFAKKLAN